MTENNVAGYRNYQYGSDSDALDRARPEARDLLAESFLQQVFDAAMRGDNTFDEGDEFDDGESTDEYEGMGEEALDEDPGEGDPFDPAYAEEGPSGAMGGDMMSAGPADPFGEEPGMGTDEGMMPQPDDSVPDAFSPVSDYAADNPDQPLQPLGTTPPVVPMDRFALRDSQDAAARLRQPSMNSIGNGNFPSPGGETNNENMMRILRRLVRKA